MFFIVKSVGFESDFGIFLLALSAPLVTVARDSKQWESVITHHI